MKPRIFWVTVLYLVILLAAPPGISFLAACVWLGYLVGVTFSALWSVHSGRKRAPHRQPLQTSHARQRLRAGRRTTVISDQ